MTATTARALQASALCLEYPDEAWRAQLPLLRQAAGSLRGQSGAALHASSTTPNARPAMSWNAATSTRSTCAGGAACT